MEIALVKNAQAPRHKPHEVEEATGTLTITRKCFRHLALDYVLQVSFKVASWKLGGRAEAVPFKTDCFVLPLSFHPLARFGISVSVAF